MNTTTATEIAQWFPKRVNGTNINKATFGHVLVIGGSGSFTGAPILTAEASARAGAGKVSLAYPKILTQSIASRLSPVIMTEAIETKSVEFFSAFASDELLALCETANISAVAIGPGLGREDSTSEFLGTFIENCRFPLVMDADALTLLASEPDQGVARIRSRPRPTVLTPHPGELAKLLNTSVADVQADRTSAARKAIEKFQCVVVLKGFQSIVADGENGFHMNSTGNAGMATGGTGDVLTGVIAALIAQGLAPWRAAVAGTYFHGLAGDIAGERIGGFTGLIATDLIECLPQAIAETQSEG